MPSSCAKKFYKISKKTPVTASFFVNLLLYGLKLYSKNDSVLFLARKSFASYESIWNCKCGRCTWSVEVRVNLKELKKKSVNQYVWMLIIFFINTNAVSEKAMINNNFLLPWENNITLYSREKAACAFVNWHFKTIWLSATELTLG